MEPSGKIESSYQSIELVSTVHGCQGTSVVVPDMSKASIMVGKVMVGNGFTPGQGLGRGGQGIREPVQAIKNHRTVGLGYHRGNAQTNKGHVRGQVGLSLPHIRETFPLPSKLLQDEEIILTSQNNSVKSSSIPLIILISRVPRRFL